MAIDDDAVDQLSGHGRCGHGRRCALGGGGLRNGEGVTAPIAGASSHAALCALPPARCV
jgi:hypothetical protein